MAACLEGRVRNYHTSPYISYTNKPEPCICSNAAQASAYCTGLYLVYYALQCGFHGVGLL